MRQTKKGLGKETPEQTTTYLLFAIAGQTYATPALSVSRIANWGKQDDLIDDYGRKKTAVNIDDAEVPIFAIHKFLGVSEPNEKVALKLEHKSGNIAIAVDEALSLIQVPDSSIAPIDKIFSEDKQWDMMRHCFIHSEDIIPIIDLSKFEID